MRRSDPSLFRERTYRQNITSKDLVPFQVAVKETDLWVSAEKRFEKETRDLILECRHQIENYIRFRPEFATTLIPLQNDPSAPPIIKQMIDAAAKMGVGPMASVAGAISEFVAYGLFGFSAQVIVENGGDIFLKTRGPATVSIFAGNSPLSNKLGLTIPARQMPLGVCSSSGTVGHSLSLGIADACCILAPSAAVADAAATAIGNRITAKKDLPAAADYASRVDGLLGGIAIVDDELVAWGDIELVDL